MSHEAAPAIALVATHCCLCGRALVDAESVECGVGPVCRRKYGYVDGPDCNRTEANRLVYEIAAAPAANDVPGKVTAIRLLGYYKLAERLTERLLSNMGTVLVTYEADTMVIESDGLTDDGFRTLLAILRSVPGRRWDANRKLNTVPVSQKRALWDALRSKMPAGVAIESDKGRVVL